VQLAIVGADLVGLYDQVTVGGPTFVVSAGGLGGAGGPDGAFGLVDLPAAVRPAELQPR
jgi:hypothetical protein